GKLSVVSDEGEYTLSKEGGKQSFCSLSSDDGVFHDQAVIDSILRKALIYGEGVYSDMLLSSQNNTALSLETLLDAADSTDAKQEITTALTKAFAESDGISIDAIERAIKEKIEVIEGKHWDFEKNQPQRKNGRWANGLGEILKAYYDFEDAVNLLDEMTKLEAECDLAALQYEKADKEAAAFEESLSSLSAFTASISLLNERKNRLFSLSEQLKKYEAAAEKWPELIMSSEQGKKLQSEEESRKIIDKFKEAEKIYAQLKNYEKLISSSLCPTESDISQVKLKSKKAAALENKLCGMNVAAKIKMLGENTVSVTSLRTNEEIKPDKDVFSFDEAVKITVPGVMEMLLSPQDADVTLIQSQLSEIETEINEILKKYSVSSLEELEEKAKKISDLKVKAESAMSKLSIILAGESYEELKEKAEISGEVRTAEEIGKCIVALSGSTDIKRFVTACETTLNGLSDEHESLDKLKGKISKLISEKEKIDSALSLNEDIPEEYRKIKDI
ncbi:MAG: hypothetical protein ACI4SB_07425, partial [Acutalibacteraceae bacterium]